MLRLAKALVMRPSGRRISILALARQREVTVAPRLVPGLTEWSGWDDRDGWCERLGVSAQSLERLVDAGVLLAQNSEAESTDALLVSDWTWGLETAALHLLPGMRSGQQVAPASVHGGTVVPLPPPVESDLIRRMVARRTVRRYARTPIAVEALSTALYAAAGEVGAKFDSKGRAHVVTTSPSGGACSPFSVVVLARHVDGLAPAAYAYESGEHRLTTIAPLVGDEAALVAGDQEWARQAPVLLLLVVDVRRTMARYRGMGAYQVLLIEAGHRAQNVLLVATERGLGGCVTSAADRKAIALRLGLEWPWRTVLYTVGLGVPAGEPRRPVVPKAEMPSLAASTPPCADVPASQGVEL